MPFNYSPPPTSGKGAFGMVPGQVGMPSPFSDLAANYPNLSQTNASVSGNIASELNGQLSPGTTRALQTTAAQHGVASGMPGMEGGSMNLNNMFGNVAGYSEGLQHQGLQDYNSTIPTISSTQTVKPETQIALGEQNAVNAAAPDPTQAAGYAKKMFDEYLAKIHPQGNTEEISGKMGTIKSSDANWNQEYWSWAHGM